MSLYQRLAVALMFAVIALIPLSVAETSLEDGPEMKIEGSDALEGIATMEGTTLYAIGEIQALVDNAQDGYTIQLFEKTYYDNVDIGSSFDGTSLNIIGYGPGRTIVDGQQNGRVFTIQPDKIVALEGMTIKNGKTGVDTIGGNIANHGGGILNMGSLTIKNCEIFDNIATSDGGGIASLAGSPGGAATLNIKNCNIHDNYAGMYGGAVISGGGPNWGSNTLNIENCNIHDNIAEGAAGGVFIYSCYSGSLTTATVKDSDIYYNTVESGNGGGITVSGAYSGIADVDVIGTAIHHNTAGNYAGGIENAGFYGKSTLDLLDCSIHHNVAAKDGGGIMNSAWSSSDIATTNIRNSDIQHNTAMWGGGVSNIPNYGKSITNIESSNINHNTAMKNGGGVYNGGEMIIKDSTITHNTADADKNDGFDGVGGGIFYQTYCSPGTKPVLLGINQIKGNTPQDIYPPMS